MKQGRTILAGLLTAAVVLGGFFLPNLVAEVQARTVQPVQVETGPAQLFSASDLSLREKLELMSKSSAVQSVEVENARHLSEEEATKYAQTYAMGFSQAAMEAAAVERVSVTPYYNLFTDSGKAFYIWGCYFWTSDGGEVLVSIDDETGALLQLTWSGGGTAAKTYGWDGRFDAARSYLMDVCATALGAVYDGGNYVEPNTNETVGAATDMTGRVMYCHLYEPETGDMFDIPVWYEGGNFYFNMFP